MTTPTSNELANNQARQPMQQRGCRDEPMTLAQRKPTTNQSARLKLYIATNMP